MGKTLFRYIFRDLLKVFLLASGAIAGMLSFGALLRPLTERGLDGSQVSQMLAYFMPAMTNYSWPVAALFATTFVYGRLSADNELTACRASGMSYAAMMVPAALLGAVVCALSLAFMWYVVPQSLVRAERVIYSNFAKLVANEIERTQKISFESQGQKLTVFATRAVVQSESLAGRTEQSVRLENPAIVTYVRDLPAGSPPVPEDFYLARSATVVITTPRELDGEVRILARLEEGAKIPNPRAERDRPSVEAQISATQFGWFPIPSQIRETSRFMDGGRLLALRERPEMSQRVSRHLTEIIRSSQQRAIYDQMAVGFNSADRRVEFSGPADAFRITNGSNRAQLKGGRLIISGGTVDSPGISFKQTKGIDPIEGLARQVTIRVLPDTVDRNVVVSFVFEDAVIWVNGQRTERQNLERTIVTDMPDDIFLLADQRVDELRQATWISPARRARLEGDLVRLTNSLESELHSRFSFAVSSFVLVMVGATIGMMFKSGNFVSAFAISTIPAIAALMLIVGGRQMCANTPREISDIANFSNPLNTGIAVMWMGNLLVLVAGLVMYSRLRRT